MPPYPREMRMTAATPTSPSKPSGIKPQNRRLVRAGTQRVTVETKESAIGPVAVILPQPDSTPLTPSFVEQLTVSLRAAASTPIRIRTTAIGEDEAAAFRAAGFDVAQRLHLLVHDLGPPELAPRGQSAGLTIRGLQVGGPFGKARTLSLLAIDHAAFAPDMRLDLGDFANALGIILADEINGGAFAPHPATDNRMRLVGLGTENLDYANFASDSCLSLGNGICSTGDLYRLGFFTRA